MNNKVKNQLLLGACMLITGGLLNHAMHHVAYMHGLLWICSVGALIAGGINITRVFRYLDNSVPSKMLSQACHVDVSLEAYKLLPKDNIPVIQIRSITVPGPDIGFTVMLERLSEPDQYLNGINDEFQHYHIYPDHYVFKSLPAAIASLEAWREKQIDGI